MDKPALPTALVVYVDVCSISFKGMFCCSVVSGFRFNAPHHTSFDSMTHL